MKLLDFLLLAADDYSQSAARQYCCSAVNDLGQGCNINGSIITGLATAPAGATQMDGSRLAGVMGQLLAGFRAGVPIMLYSGTAGAYTALAISFEPY